MINKASQQLEDQLVNRITDLERQVRDIKNIQLIGGDNTVVEGTNLLSLPNSFANGQSRIYTITFNPTGEYLSMPDLKYSLFIGVDNDLEYLFPGGIVDGVGGGTFGGSLSDDQLAFTVEVFPDWKTSADSIGRRVWSIRITSNTVFGPYTVYFYAKVYAVKNPAVL